ncbi:MAG: alpha-E domain-containing protein [Planctomycetota bacterium]
MLSRVADSVFWLSRYLERAENVARFIEVNHSASLGYSAGHTQWSPLIYTTGDQSLFEEHYDEFSQTNVINFLTFDRRNPNSILCCLESARENARTVRESITFDLWHELNRFYHFVRDHEGDQETLRQPHDFLGAVKQQSYAINGITDVTITHGEAWHFSQIGRLLERADKTSRIVDVKYFILLPSVDAVGGPLDVVQWSALLKSATGLTMYRRQFGRIRPREVLKFLILDRFFPRSIRFCVIRAEESLRAITGADAGTFSTKVDQGLGRLRSALDYSSVDEIISGGVHEFIDDIQEKINDVGSLIGEAFFSRPTPDTTSTANQ